MKGPGIRQAGFTLVELVVMMIVVGILGAVAASRFVDRAAFDAAAYTEQIRAVIRYGQKLAVAQNRQVFVRLNGSSVSLCFVNESDCGAGNRVPAASGANSGVATTLDRCDNSPSWACEGNPAGISYTSTANGALFSFDALGRSRTSAGAAVATITVSITGDGTTRTVTVESETGYVH